MGSCSSVNQLIFYFKCISQNGSTIKVPSKSYTSKVHPSSYPNTLKIQILALEDHYESEIILKSVFKYY